MQPCPNCGYELVLLSRGKYKCSLCSKLYLPKKIESRTFKIWNQKQRELDLHNLNLEIQQVQKDKKERKLLRAFKLIFKNTRNPLKQRKPRIKLSPEELKQRNKHYGKWYYNKNKERLLEQDEAWREANRETCSLTYKRWLANNKEKRQAFLKAYRIKNRTLERQKGRIHHWRKKQKLLADAYLENNNHKASNIQFFPFSPTF
ncbi:MAG: hypothetical protein CMH63_00095 [Nanoarchaeota archaeon]|nr:hypothetical protein [Nanoarchaeota archaeon]|tara:strand:- start:14 stop:622 length:609 start_codon:yes stop_codon:yes gene_type:complete